MGLTPSRPETASMDVCSLRAKCQPLSVIVRRRLMVIVIRDSDLSRVDVHVNHLDPEMLLQVAARSIYPGLFVPAGIFSLAVFLHLD